MKFDDLPDLSAEQPSSTGADSHWTSGASLTLHADSVVSGEIVAVVGFAVAHCATILERVVGPQDSSKDVEAGEVVAVAVDDSEVFVSDEIVEFVEFQLEECQRDLDSADDRSLFGPIPCGCNLGAEPM